MSYNDFKKVSEVTVKFDIQVANECLEVNQSLQASDADGI
jgi:hypothetical protein